MTDHDNPAQPTSSPSPQEPAEDLAADLLARLGGSAATGAKRRPATSTPPKRKRRRRPDAPVQYSGPSLDARDPVSIDAALAQVVADQGWSKNTRLASAMAKWEDIAGAEVAAHVRAESFTEGVLTLRADSTAWATQLRMLLPTLRSRIDAAVGQGVVAEISVKGPDAPRQRGLWRVAGRGPRDTYG